MKFTLVYAIILALLSVNAAARSILRRNSDKICKKGDTISDGTQISTGSCSKFTQGEIPSSDNMPSTLIISPENGAVLESNKQFDIDILISNIETGKFSDPEKQYNSVPQKLNSDGLILGHTHVTVQKLVGKQPPDAKEFDFFKGINDVADSNGQLSVSVVDDNGNQGLNPGNYRICTMAGSFSHQPVVMPVAKRGAQDDCIRVKVK